MHTLAERARWCVLHGRLANEEFDRIRPKTVAQTWKRKLEDSGGYLKYLDDAVNNPGGTVTVIEGDWYAQRYELDRLMCEIKAELAARERALKLAHENFSRAAVLASVDLLAKKPGAWKPVEIKHGDRAKVRLRWTPRQFT